LKRMVKFLRVLYLFSNYGLLYESHKPTCTILAEHDFPLCSQTSQSVAQGFAIAPCFNPIGFAQSPPLLTYVRGPKGHLIRHSVEFYISRQHRVFLIFLSWANQNISLQKKKKVGLERHININQTTYASHSFLGLIPMHCMRHNLLTPAAKSRSIKAGT
jgi:hypothetical protein